MEYIQIILAGMFILAILIMMMQVTSILKQYKKTVQQNYMLQVEVNRLKAKDKESAMMLAKLKEDNKMLHFSNEWLESGNYVVERAQFDQHLEDKRLSESKFELVE